MAAYATSLPREISCGARCPVSGSELQDDWPGLPGGSSETLAAYWLTLDAINFGSGWFPTLRKRPGRSGYRTVADGLGERFAGVGPWSAAELSEMDAAEIASVLGQDPQHELMALFAASLRDLGRLVLEYAGSFASLAQSTGGSAVKLALRLGASPCFADCSSYEGICLRFLKRAQIAAADLARAGVIVPRDLDGLTMFADNLVPHALRLDGILHFDPELVARIERGELIEHGSTEEVEIRAAAVHAVELIVAAGTVDGSGERVSCAAEVDQLLWLRGQGARYKASPRHRCRCTAY